MTNTRQPTLLIIDAMCVIRRIYEGVPVADPAGKAEGAIKAAASSILKTIRALDPTHFLLGMDTHGPNWRHEIFEGYKQHRPPTPQALVDAIPGLLEQLDSYGLKSISKAGYEADDVINTVAIKAASAGMRVIVDSTDKDFLVLLSKGIELWDHFKRSWRDEAYCKAKFGISSELITDYLALAGDDDDGIPGINGVGPVTAAALLNEYGSLQEIINNCGSLKGKLGEKVRSGIAMAQLSHRLATMSAQVPMEMNASDLRLPGRLPSPSDAYNGLRMKKPMVSASEMKVIGLSTETGLNWEERPGTIELVLYVEKGMPHVSHGIDNETGRNVILPNESLSNFQRSGARYSERCGAWFLPPADRMEKVSKAQPRLAPAQGLMRRLGVGSANASTPVPQRSVLAQMPPDTNAPEATTTSLRRMRSTKP